MTTARTTRPRERRSDASQNHESLVRAATTAVHRDGARVPMATIAADAGVGIGTLYRHFATREELLSYLTHRSFKQVLSNALAADRNAGTGADALRRFVRAAIDQRDQLVLPLHGGPSVTAPETLTVRRQVHQAIRAMIRRGQSDATIIKKVNPLDIVALGSMLAQPQRSDPAWTTLCHRVLDTYLDGLRAAR